MKSFLISVYDKLVMSLVFVGIIGGTIISYNLANLGYNFSFGFFLLGLIITIVITSLSCGLLLIQIQNNELLHQNNEN